LDAEANLLAQPIFLTVTETVGIDSGHTDVSLWFVVDCQPDQTLSWITASSGTSGGGRRTS
jgi:hypothetical protein